MTFHYLEGYQGLMVNQEMFDQCPMPINANHIFMVLRLHASYGAKQNVLGGSVSQ